MKKKILLLLSLCFTITLFAQYQITIEAKVIDKKSKQPIEFTNVEFIERNIKTVSNKEGVFILSYDEDHIGKMDRLRFSAYGYKTVEVTADQFYKFLKNSNKIYLDPKLYFQNDLAKTLIYKIGKVYSSTGPIQNATVKIKNSFTEVQTDVEGNYKINAKEDDVLVVSYLGMIDKEVLVTKSKLMVINLESDAEILEEVQLKGENKTKNDIETGFDKKSEDAIGYSINTITSKDIKSHHTNWVDVIRGRFAGITVSGLDPNNPKFMIRGGGSINNPAFALIEIDGAIYTDNPPGINPQQIESITILKSLAATTKYGTIGRGGVIKIQTKHINRHYANNKKASALVKGNDYVGSDIALINAKINKPAYLIELEKEVTFEDAKRIYLKQKNQDTQLSIPYFFDVSDYFMKWDKDYAYTILTTISKIAYNNSKALHTLAYKLEEFSKLDKAKEIYQRIATLRPNDAQTYRDLALIYQQTGYFKEALELYGQMLNNQINNVDFTSLIQPITNELKHLLANHRSKIDYSNVHPDYLKTDFKYDLRIVFDWNDSNTEFEIQFVNPKGKYYKWSHMIFENKERMQDEVKFGYHTEEYIIDDADSGEWIINIECLSEEKLLNPTYLKYTVYKNYGLKNETKRVKVIKLYNQQHKVTLDKFFYK